MQKIPNVDVSNVTMVTSLALLTPNTVRVSFLEPQDSLELTSYRRSSERYTVAWSTDYWKIVNAE